MPNKIGIITYYRSINYGAILQAYALYSFLKSLEYDVELIDYTPTAINWEERKYLYFSKYYLFNPQMLIKSINRRLVTNNFIKANLKISKQKFSNGNDLKKYNHPYDVVICGSDEIWNIAYRGLDKSYFIDFLNKENVKKISYAASFGSTTCIDGYQEELSKLFQDFSALSVRDNNSLSLVKQCGAKVEKVLDPTLLINQSDYGKILKNPYIKNPYILIYGRLSDKEVKIIADIVQKTKLDVISIGSHQRFLKKIVTLDLFDVSPEYWLGYFCNADLIVTKFYHGVVFSIIFNNPFIFFDTPSKSIKVKDLLGTLKLENRIIDSNNDDINRAKNDHNWLLTPPLSEQKQKNILREHIKYSQDFLCQALQNKF